ncbi:hypothetical protein NDU88_003740 [Pleurodeles waltl]|uniref:Uncharacterized protein n=1 Tax=Pleurodeles waltl TaxID=8319 RepID=A0AAV7W312_PLEWA|nr:hypothetical protein NDU88_003740 [Pleurodeles waltl]
MASRPDVSSVPDVGPPAAARDYVSRRHGRGLGSTAGRVPLAGVVESVEPSPAPPAGPTLPRPGFRAGRECDSWCRLKPSGLRPRKPPAHTQHAKRARRPDANAGPSAGRAADGPSSRADIHTNQPRGRSLM